MSSDLGSATPPESSVGRASHNHVRHIVLFYVFLVCLLFELSPRSSLVLLFLFIVLSKFGASLLQHVGLKDLPVAVGLTLGAGTLTLVSQVLLFIGIPAPTAQWVAIGLLGCCSLVLTFSPIRSDPTRILNDNPQTEFCFLISVGAVSIRHLWLIPIAFGLLAVHVCISKFGVRNLYTFICIAGLGLSWAISVSLRPENWWYNYQGNDSQFFESIGWSISQWGLNEHPGYVHGSIAGYHWLSYGFMGHVSQLAQLEPWDSMMKVAAILMPFLFTSLLVGSVQRGQMLGQTGRWILTLTTVVVMPIVRFDSFAFSIVVAASFLYIVLADQGKASHFRRSFLYLLISTVLVLSKVSTAAVVGVVLVLEYVYSRLSKRQSSVAPLLCLLGTAIVLSITAFRDTTGRSVLRDSYFNFNASLIELKSLFESRPLVIQFCLLIGLVIFTRRRECYPASSFRTPVLWSMVVLLTASIIRPGSTSTYFGYPGIYLASIVFLSSSEFTPVRRSGRQTRIRWISLFLATLLTGYYSEFLLTSATRWSVVANLSRGYVWEVIRGTGFILGFMIAVVILGRRLYPKTGSALIVLALGFLGFLIGSNANTYQATNSRLGVIYEVGNYNSAPFATSDLREVATWIRRETKQDAVLASNNFCCAGLAWWSSAIASAQDETSRLFDESRWGGANYLLPAETRRRFLVQGLRFQTGIGVPTKDQIRRMTLSLQFANQPSPETVTSLKQYGVSGFVVNLSLTDRRDWTEFASERKRVGNFLYLELR
ncbi:MAG: hypothetical protein EBU84_11425 [Actinobacteria bacterium]|nr:hypothetical protein [Actinomycetota bacterium]